MWCPGCEPVVRAGVLFGCGMKKPAPLAGSRVRASLSCARVIHAMRYLVSGFGQTTGTEWQCIRWLSVSVES